MHRMHVFHILWLYARVCRALRDDIADNLDELRKMKEKQEQLYSEVHIFCCGFPLATDQALCEFVFALPVGLRLRCFMIQCLLFCRYVERTQIDSLEKDIKGHLKEIKEREATIADKVHRIFELRKKNQELEKFKFVLDYKVGLDVMEPVLRSRSHRAQFMYDLVCLPAAWIVVRLALASVLRMIGERQCLSQWPHNAAETARLLRDPSSVIFCLCA